MNFSKKIFFFFLLFICYSNLSSAALSLEQAFYEKKVTLNLKNKSLTHILTELQKQCDIDFGFSEEIDPAAMKTFSAQFTNLNVEAALKTILKNSGYAYKLHSDKIVIVNTPDAGQAVSERIIIKGIVLDQEGKPVPGANVIIAGTNTGVSTDSKGAFSLSIETGSELMISFIGMITWQQTFTKSTDKLVVRLKNDNIAVDEVVVTGIYTRSREAFTGSSATFNNKDLKIIGNQNILQSLKTLDPSFAIIESNEWGSDPNRLPDIEIRGKTSIVGLNQTFQTDPNQPLFILDGFESSLAIINDLSMDRVESITILKDAAATAIYGSKAANGVVVVTTKSPEVGKLRINYNGDFTFSFADLTDYNLMNAAEKVQFERLSGYYGSLDANGVILDETKAAIYNRRLAEVAKGVNSYWLSDPLRFATTHKHNLFIEGGDHTIRYGVGLSYSKIEGVMKGSDRDVFNGNMKLMYNRKTLSFNNQFNYDYSLASRESVDFSQFSMANPYFRKYDEDGNVLKMLAPSERSLSGTNLFSAVYSPLYNTSLKNYNRTNQYRFRNNFEAIWRAFDGFQAKGRLSLSKELTKQNIFTSPKHSKYVDKEDVLQRGEYSENHNENFSYDGDINLTYAKVLGERHILNATGGLRLSHNAVISGAYSVLGFIDENFNNPAFSNSYSDGKPAYSESARRSASYYLNVGYSYANRYMTDISLRYDGTSVFGTSKRFAETWAVGAGWNLHNEQFMKNISVVNFLKIKASIGNPGNQNFDDYIAMKIYANNPWNLNPFGLSSIISKFGNRELKWQKTLDLNIGADIDLFQSRLKITYDWFTKKTDPLLIMLTVPTSTGVDNIPRNFGAQQTKGMTFKIIATAIKTEQVNWQINGTLRIIKTTYQDIGKSLEKYNRDNFNSGDILRISTAYYDGASPSDIWAVVSRGIDPGTGREVFLKKDGTETFTFDYDDRVVVGNTTPKAEGVIGTMVYYKNFRLSANMRYRWGGQIRMDALYNKVENITAEQLRYNQDRRALTGRWQKPGDIVPFRSISLTQNTPMSSRFVQDENTLSGESISIGYDSSGKWVKSLGASMVTFSGYMNEIFHLSSVTNERGIRYPFARSVSFSLGVKF